MTTSTPPTQPKEDPWHHFFNSKHNPQNIAYPSKVDPTRTSATHLLAAAHALHPFTKATTILDLGCGPGTVTSLLLTSYTSSLPDNAKILATDFSPSMIQRLRDTRAQKIADGEARWENVKVEQQDACDLVSVDSGSISHALAGFVLFMVPSPAKALAEAHRVLSPGGVLSLTSWRTSEWVELFRDMCSEVDVNVPTTMERTLPSAWRSVEGVAEQLEKAGFEEVQGEEFECGMSFESAEGIVGFLAEVVPHFREMVEGAAGRMEEGMEEGKKMLRRSMVERLEGRHGKGKGVMSGTAVVASGRKSA